jgi:hypothetical protein
MRQPTQANVASTVVSSDTFAEMSDTGTVDVRLGAEGRARAESASGGGTHRFRLTAR